MKGPTEGVCQGNPGAGGGVERWRGGNATNARWTSTRVMSARTCLRSTIGQSRIAGPTGRLPLDQPRRRGLSSYGVGILSSYSRMITRTTIGGQNDPCKSSTPGGVAAACTDAVRCMQSPQKKLTSRHPFGDPGPGTRRRDCGDLRTKSEMNGGPTYFKLTTSPSACDGYSRLHFRRT